jgi:hypothetical protein
MVIYTKERRLALRAISLPQVFGWWNLHSFGANTWRSESSLDYTSRRKTNFRPRCRRRLAQLQLNWVLHQPRQCRSQHLACPRLSAIIGRLHAMPLYWPDPSRPRVLKAIPSLAAERDSSHRNNELSSTASCKPGTSPAGHECRTSADQPSNAPAPRRLTSQRLCSHHRRTTDQGILANTVRLM